MANLKAIRRRIGSVRNTQKITRAMKMVAAARFRRAQEAAEAFRSYAEGSRAMLAEVAGGPEMREHPLFARREVKQSVTLVLTSDRGLCGAFNGNLCRFVEAELRSRTPQPRLAVAGRKGYDYFSRRALPLAPPLVGVWEELGYATAARLAGELLPRYLAGELDELWIGYNAFVSAVSQKPTLRRLLPIEPPARPEGEKGARALFVFEPPTEELVARLVPMWLESEIFGALLESVAAEHGARMSAMDAATNNAEDMLRNLTLVYNRVRQGAITRDLIDIVGGAEALHD